MPQICPAMPLINYPNGLPTMASQVHYTGALDHVGTGLCGPEKSKKGTIL